MVCKLCGTSLVDKHFLGEGKEDGSLSVLCLDCGLKQKGFDPDKYRDGFYDEAEMSDEDESSEPDSQLVDDFKLDILKVSVTMLLHGLPDKSAQSKAVGDMLTLCYHQQLARHFALGPL